MKVKPVVMKKKIVNNYKLQVEQRIKKKGVAGLTMEEALVELKFVLEATIKKYGEKGKTSLIRSQMPIKLIHEAIKTSLINAGINPANIKPSLGSSSGELKLSGFLKRKDQDICVMPNLITPIAETMADGLLAGEIDSFGFNLTESIISINVRSQLSSLGNNTDTLYERTFAESLNLHIRCPKICLGEVYMIPVFEYDKHIAQTKHVAWIEKMTSIENYIKAFSAINLRANETDANYKYERVCLLIVNFKEPVPKIYNTDDELKTDGLIPRGSTVSIEHLNYSDFVSELVAVYSTRFPDNTFN
jgi:hypothetical protein